MRNPSTFLGNLARRRVGSSAQGHENRTGCSMDRVAFIEEVWTVVQCNEIQSMLKTGLNRPLMREILDKLDKREGRMSELLIDSVIDESEVNSPIKATQQESSEEVVYQSRTRKGTMRLKKVIDTIIDMKINLGSKVTLRKTGKTEISF